MKLFCLFHGHKYKFIKEIFKEDSQDAFHASNFGTGIMSYGFDILRCSKCGKQIQKSNGKRVYNK